MKHRFDQVTIEVVSGDIASQRGIEAVVNAANAQLLPGGGVAGAIHRGAGPGLAEECHPLAPIRPGQAVITGAHDLPNRFVIHCLGPVYGRDKPADVLLRECYKNALRLAEKRRIRSIAFPSISTGVFGYPMVEAARIALATAVAETAGLRHVNLIRFVIFGAEALKVHEEALSDLVSGDS